VAPALVDDNVAVADCDVAHVLRNARYLSLMPDI
jgi:hypothetical protein